MDRPTGPPLDAEYQLETFLRHSALHSDTSHPLGDIDVNQSETVPELPEHGTTLVTSGRAPTASTSDDKDTDTHRTHSILGKRASGGDTPKLEIDQGQKGDQSACQSKSSFQSQGVNVEGIGEGRQRAMGQASQELATTLGDAAALGEDQETCLPGHEPDIGSTDVSAQPSAGSLKDGRSKGDPRPSNQSNSLSLWH